MVEVLSQRKVSQHYVNVLELRFLLLVCGMVRAMSIPGVWCGRAQHSCH